MLCPQCRRMVGKDGYCPMGHLARPELQEKPAPPVIKTPPPPPVPAERPAPPVESDPYTPPGLGPSNPPPQQPATAAAAPDGGVSAAPMPAPAGTYPPPPPVPSEGLLPSGATKKSNRLTAVLVALGLAAVATVGFFMFGGSAGAANLKYVFTAGETHRYQMSMTMKVAGGNLIGGGSFDGTIDMVMTQTVRDVDDAGVATIEFSFQKVQMTEGGRRQPIPVPNDVVSIEMAPDGRVLDSSGTEFLGDINPAAGIFGPESFSPILPRHKVDPGDVWSLDGDAPNPFGEAFHIKGDARYLKREGVGDQETAVIQSTVDSPIDFRIEFAKLADMSGEALPPGFPSNAAMTFVGNLSMDLTQSMATKTGFLRSALGDMSMTGTFGIENVPQIGNINGVLNMQMQLTLTAL